MLGVKRYDPEVRKYFDPWGDIFACAEMREFPDGEYVKWEDYKSLLAKYLALRSTMVCGEEKGKKQRNTSAKSDEHESWKGSRWKYKKIVSGTVVVDRVLNGTVHWYFEQLPYATIPKPMHKFLRDKERLE